MLGCGTVCGCRGPCRLGAYVRPSRTLTPGAPNSRVTRPPGLAFALRNAAPQAQSRLADVLEAYVRRKLAAGQAFYITDELNSDALRSRGLGGLGFFAEIGSAIASAVGSISSVVGPAAQVAAAVHTIEGAGGGGGSSSSSVTPDQIAQAILPQVQAKLAAQGVTLPSDVAHQAVSASILDAFGPQYRPLVTAGLLGLGLAVLIKLIRG